MTRLRARDEAPPRPAGVEEGSVVTVFRVPPEMAGMRVDRFLHTQLKRTSRTRANEIARASAHASDGRRLRPGDRVQAEQRVLLWRPPWDENPVPTDLPVLYEDEHLFAVDKPSGVPVHPSARYYRNTVVKLLEAARPGQWLSLAHRIDRETSGVLLLSRSPEADRAIKRAFESREGMQKTYLALAWGEPPPPARRIDLPLELDPDAKTKVRMRVAAPGAGLSAATRVALLETRRRDGRPYSLLRCDLETGRQHQIRAHLAATGNPIVGDKLYAFDEGYFARSIDGLDTDEDRA
ncbi:MAG TPA: RluA family pseudouridine synthase, partial [Polyangiaceae bacterium]|nr:RluA family pseudouridine synthase [Polyangiaceae bacterium]